MTGSLDELSFAAWPPAIDISTPANSQSFNPQFSVANTGATETISLTRALLLVPVTTTGTNLAQSTDMAPDNITPGWSFQRAPVPPRDQGCAAFLLTPDDGVGAIAPGGSVAFTLTGVSVNTVAGTAVLRLEGKTSAGAWAPTCPIQLTTPSTTPAITRHGITPGNPQTLITLQGQTVVLSWTTTGAAYCVIEDDQGNKWENLPTSGTISDKPLQGNSEVLSTSQLGLYYNRTYHFYAFAAGATQSDDRSDTAIIQLLTLSSFSVSPTSITAGQSVTVAWSVANIDPELGTIALTIDPADGTGVYPIAIPPTQTSGSWVVTPTPLTTTTYTFAIDNGHGIALSWPQQTVTSPHPPGWEETERPENVSFFGLFLFANRLWCFTEDPQLWWTNGTGWTAVTSNLTLPSLDGVIVADLGDGEKLWAFGNTPFVASSSDGIHWDAQPTPPYSGRIFGSYVAGNGTILVAGGEDDNENSLTDIWSTSDGRTWTHVGNNLPGVAVARFAGKLQAAGYYAGGYTGWTSSDEGKTWGRTTMPSNLPINAGFLSTVPVGGMLLLFGLYEFGKNQVILKMDAGETWSVLSMDLVPPAPADMGTWSAVIYLSYLWFGFWDDAAAGDHVYRLNKLIPGTTLTLTPTGNSSSD